MINDKNGLAFALIQDTWQFWKTFGDLELKTEHDWAAVTERAIEVIDKYATTPYQNVADTFVRSIYEWLEDKSREEH